LPAGVSQTPFQHHLLAAATSATARERGVEPRNEHEGANHPRSQWGVKKFFGKIKNGLAGHPKGIRQHADSVSDVFDYHQFNN
jgi:hypothetical protein